MGGGRGGGKTEAGFGFLIKDDYYRNPLYRALVVRRNADDLKDWIDRARGFFRPLKAEIVGNPPEIRFPNPYNRNDVGAVIRTGHLKDENAYRKYQGHEYHRQLIEELTHISTEQQYLMLTASCRSSLPEFVPQVFGTTNPDGPGHVWVKKRWRLSGIPTEPLRTYDDVTHRWRVYVPSRIEDNKFLMENDPSYVSFLEGLPDGLREQWRQGSWDDYNIKGAYYTNEIRQMQREGRIRFVPFDPLLKVHTVWDLGVSDSMTILFVQRISTEVRVIAAYSNENFGLNHYAGILQQYQSERGYVYGKHFAPHDINVRELSSGQTRLQLAEKLGIKFTLVPNISVEAGREQLRIMFTKLWITNAYGGEEALDALRQHRQEYVDAKQIFKSYHDWTSHFADTFRYLALVEKLMTNENKKPIKRPAPYVAKDRYEGGRQRDDSLL